MRLFLLPAFLLGSVLLTGIPAIAQTNPGDVVWEFNTLGRVFATPAIAPDGTIYVGDEVLDPTPDDASDDSDGILYAINPDGTEKWRFEGADDWLDSSPAIGPDGTIYVGCWDNFLYAIDPADGTQKWRYETGSVILGSPAISGDGTVYIASNDNLVYGVNPDGSLRYGPFLLGTDDIDGAVDAGLAISPDGTIIAVTRGGEVYSLPPDLSVANWVFQAQDVGTDDGRILSSPAIDDEGRIYFGTGSGVFYALDANGQELWSHPQLGDGSPVDSSPCIGPEGNIYVGGRNGIFYAYSNAVPSVGEQKSALWTLTLGDIWFCSPAVDTDGRVYIAHFVERTGGVNYSRLVSLSADGTEQYLSYDFGATNDSSPVLGPNDTLYLGAFDNRLIALHNPQTPAATPWPKFGGNLANHNRHLSGDPPVINTAFSSGAAADTGGTTLLRIEADGESLSFQWRKDGVPIDGATGATLMVQGDDSAVGFYDVVVYNGGGQAFSGTVPFTLVSPPELQESSPSLATLSFDYKRPVNAGSLYEVVGSPDMTTWITDGIAQTVLETLDGVEHVRATATLGNATTFFLALRVQFP